MQGAMPSDCQAIAVRIQRLLDEALDRHASGSEAERVQALVDTLRVELRGLPATERGSPPAGLRALNPDVALPGPRAPQGPSARELDLEAEVERLRAALAEPAAPPATAPPGALERALVLALTGPGKD